MMVKGHVAVVVVQVRGMVPSDNQLCEASDQPYAREMSALKVAWVQKMTTTG